MNKKLFTVLILAIVFIFTACGSKTKEVGGQPEETTTAVTTSETTTTPPPKPDSVVKVTASGDNLIHSSIYDQAKKRSKDGTYDFDFAYENVKKLINGDINMINQETPVANDIFPPSTYPMFNSPAQLGDKMLGLGFNVFNLANNHCLDKGEKGAFATLDYWNSKNAVTCGMYKDETDRDTIRTMTKNEITFSFLGFTDHTNGLNIPQGSPLIVNYTYNIESMQKQIEEARKISDVVIVYVHWGVENSHIISENQRALAKKMSDWGADVIIGTHPHVIQGVEEITSSTGRNTLVAYSLGNFISAQDVGNRLIGGMLDFDVRKNFEENTIKVENVKFIPVITHYGHSFSNVTVYPFSDYTKELADSHGVKVKSQFSYDFILKTLKDNIDEKYLDI